MKKALYGTTALIAAGLLYSGPAMAQAKPVQLGIGGYFVFYGAFASQDDGVGQGAANIRDHGFFQEGEIHFDGSTTLDNGIKVGLRIELEAQSSTDQIDEAYITFDSAFGQLRLGQDDGAPNRMFVGRFGVAPRLGVSAPANVILSSPGAATYTGGNSPNPEPGTLSSDSEKVTYLTPRVAGLQGGFSYSPDRCESSSAANAVGGATGGCGAQGGNALSPDNNTSAGHFSEIWEIAANYIQTFAGVGIELFAGYSVGQPEVAAIGGVLTDDHEHWGVSGALSYMGFQLAGIYSNSNNGLQGNNETDAWATSLEYKMGPWGASIGYGGQTVEQGAAGGEDENTLFELAGSYALGPGIDLAAGIVRGDFEDNVVGAAGQNEAWAVFVGTHIKF